MEVKKSICFLLQEISLSLSFKMDEEVHITEVEKSMSTHSKKVGQSFFEISTPYLSIVFSQTSQSSILISTPSPPLSLLDIISTPLKLSPDTYDPFQIILKVSNLKVDKVKKFCIKIDPTMKPDCSRRHGCILHTTKSRFITRSTSIFFLTYSKLHLRSSFSKQRKTDEDLVNLISTEG